jgi:hypothetical protein
VPTTSAPYLTLLSPNPPPLHVLIPPAGVLMCDCACSRCSLPKARARPQAVIGKGVDIYTHRAPAGYFTVARGRHLLRLRWSSRPRAGAAVASDSRISEWIGRVSSLQSDWRWGGSSPPIFRSTAQALRMRRKVRRRRPQSSNSVPLRQPSCALRDHVLTGVLSYSQRSLQRWGPASQQRP